MTHPDDVTQPLGPPSIYLGGGRSRLFRALDALAAVRSVLAEVLAAYAAAYGPEPPPEVVRQIDAWCKRGGVRFHG